MGLTPGRAVCLKKRNPAVSNYDITYLKPHNQGLSVIHPSLRISNTTNIFYCCFLAFLRQVCCCVCRILFEYGQLSCNRVAQVQGYVPALQCSGLQLGQQELIAATWPPSMLSPDAPDPE